MNYLGLRFDPIDMDGACAILRSRTCDDAYAYMVTPNVDHVVRLAELPATSIEWNAYRQADWCLCDSRVLSLFAAADGVPLPVVPGSDLTANLFGSILTAGDRLCIIGGHPGDPARLIAGWPDLDIVQYIPPMGLRHDAEAREQAARFAATSGARFTLLAVGSPQQELIATAIGRLPNARGTALCIGASLDFLVGRERRAPRWMRRMALEWLHRLWVNPRRMWRRYLPAAPRMLRLRWRYRHSVRRGS
jgi:exopolysaccharide biosynthesis WecB/TagA/CpsF family protein